MTALGIMLIGSGVLLVWTGVTDPSGGLPRAIGDVLSGKKSPAAGALPSPAPAAGEPSPSRTTPVSAPVEKRRFGSVPAT